MKKFKFTESEKQSKRSRIDLAELLISQLPKDHDGRNTWLMNYGVKRESRKLRKLKGLSFDSKTMACCADHEGDDTKAELSIYLQEEYALIELDSAVLAEAYYLLGTCCPIKSIDLLMDSLGYIKLKKTR